MFDFLGYSCYSPLVWWVKELAFWWLVGLGVYDRLRIRRLKAALAANTAAPRPASATRIDDQRGGRTWDIGSTGPNSSTLTPPKRVG